MRWFFALIVVLVGTLAASAQETRIAAVVNDEIITLGDVSARLQLVMRSSNTPDTPENRKRLSSQILRTLIDEKLQMQEAKRLGMNVTQAEINSSLANLEQRNNMPAGGLDDYLKRQGIPKNSLVDQLTAVLAFGKVVRNRVSQDVSVSDEEVSEAMARLQAEEGKPQYRVSEIFLAIDNPSQEDDVRKTADRIIEQIRGGANFFAVAQQFSQSPTAAVGGDIGWVTASQVSSLIGEALQKMNPGEMSYPIRMPAGFYILYLVDRKTLGAANPDQTSLSLVEVVFALPQGAPDADRQKVEAQAKAVSDTAKSCGEMTRVAKEQAPQLSRQIAQVRAGELPPDLRKPILALKIAEPSKPLPMSGGIGVVMVCQRQDPPGLPTRDEVQESIARERFDTLARRYLRDLRREAFVDIRG
jgi:peptidyl-prolyl cis-trans isomerase SurA